jgi:alpha-ketoglutarate-dependent taurine dioxygenase
MTAQPELRPLGQALGMEALGIDLAHLDDDKFTWIRHAFAEHPVLVFREQSLAAGELAGFGARFGKPRPHSLINYRYPGQLDVSYLRNVDDGGKIDWFGVKRATAWHTDSTYETDLPLLAILHALEVPSQRGGTVFADMRAAYDALAPEMKERLAGLTGLRGHTSGPAGGELYRNNEAAKTADKEYEEKPWPAITKHPVTGRPILFVNPMHVHGFVGMEKDAAWGLIEELARHSTRLGPHRGAGAPFDAGANHLLPLLAGRRCRDVGRAGDDAPRRR